MQRRFFGINSRRTPRVVACRVRLLQFLFLALMLFSAATGPVSSSEVIIGTGTSTWDMPLITLYHDARIQIIYLASEIGGAGQITGLALDVGTTPGQTLNDFTIRLKHTTLSTYTTKSWESTDWTVCYQADTTVSATGWVQFTFTTPFSYDGVSNLMVDFSFNNSSYSTSGRCRFSTPGGTRSIYYPSDSEFDDPLFWSGTSNPTPISSSFVPNVRLTFGPVTEQPVFTPAGGGYNAAQQVTVTCATPGAVIHYTLNGLDPTASDPVVASGAQVLVPVSPSTTLKARAWATGMDPSPIASALYRLPRLIHVSSSGSDANDGLTWASAKKTVAGGLAASGVGDEVWVKAGTYAERIILKAGAALYGGFAGTETARNQRNWAVNKTILDGGQGGSVVTSPASATSSTRIDGFTIRNGAAANGGGVYCYLSSPTIANNIIMGNSATDDFSDGGGIYCEYSSPTIANNTITGNSAAGVGAAIYCDSSSPTISNNTITGNSAGWGQGGAIYCWSSNPSIANNIVAFNDSGISNYAGSPVLRSNCLFGNPAYNYSGLSAGAGDISVDPRLESWQWGKLHIQPDSPCRDAGDDIAVGAGWLDMDAQARIQGSHVDIGADESDGTQWPEFTPTTVVRVSSDGNDANDGSSWLQAKKTVQAGIEAAALSDGEVWVKAGTYAERITLKPYVLLYGGFAGAETARIQRNWALSKTILDGGQGGSVVTVRNTARLAGCIDGFTIQNGSSAARGGGISCAGSSPAIANNTITGNSASGGGGGIYCDYSSPAIAGNTITSNSATGSGGGIYCDYSSPSIVNNTVTGNSAYEAGGIYCDYSAPIIANNTIAINGAASVGGGISCYYSGPSIAGNAITDNGASQDGGGIFCLYSSLAITNNAITGNSASSYGGGIYGYDSSVTISNNTITDNGASQDGGGIFCWRIYSSSSISNNIIKDNWATDGGGIICWEGGPSIINNTIKGNTAYSNGGGLYCFSSDPTISSNIIADNSASTHGGGIYCLGHEPSMSNNTITGNSASEGGGIYCYEYTPSISSNIVAFNNSGIYYVPGVYSPPVLHTNCVFGNTAYNYSGLSPGIGDISVDPLFVDRVNKDYHLQSASPCINAGDDAFVPPWLLVDMDGKARISGSHVDMGAYELGQAPATAIPAARGGTDGKPVSLNGVVVTAVWPNVFYVEQSDRACGIRVEKAAHGLSVGQSVALTGIVATTSNGERFIQAAAASGGAGQAISALGMNMRALGGESTSDYSGPNGTGQQGVIGGVGLNNIGLLVRTAGTVSFIDPGGDYFVLSDGSDIADPDGHPGVRVVAPGLIPGGLAVGDGVAVTGISSCIKSGEDLYPKVLVRSASDIE